MATIMIRLLTIVHICFVLLWIVTGLLYYIHDVYGPTLKFPNKVGKDHNLEDCGPTTDNFDDLIVSSSLTHEQAAEQTQTHGSAIVREVLSTDTAFHLRNYILKANHEIESTFVLNRRNRFHIMPTHKEPTIQAAFKEIASHQVLKPLIDNVVGPRSSLVAFSVITNLYGAKDQEWHYDTATSHANYPAYFVPEYTLAIPLQDTTKEMGATGICPGTHKCSWPDFDWETLEELYENDEYTSHPDFDTWSRYNMPCNLTAAVNSGDGLLYSADLYHRGAGHKDADAPERVVIFLTFGGSRRHTNDERSLPLGTVHSLDWRSWGHTIDDFLTVDTKPWRLWHVFGLFAPCKQHGVRPWTVQDYFLMIFKHKNEAMHMISADFDLEYFTEVVDKLYWKVAMATVVYVSIAPLVWMVLFRRLWNPNQRQNPKIKQA
jgi:hypothetical protein